MDIQRRVQNLIKKYDTNDPYRLAKALGISVVVKEMPNKLRGCCLYMLRNKFIGISSELSKAGALVVLAHELGHIRLHGRGTYSCTIDNPRVRTKYEHEANIFALLLLSSSRDVDVGNAREFLKLNKSNPQRIHQALCEIFDNGL